ncbi:hypothetical protein AV530_007615 [Patagioenas fasciata monilis]|uniref:Uncharacterized protein n=1 Tax=Patagioenas fasciata monilis TaxID=372326 RepID=A0A1V4JYS5_PATFA|nr:hypothetical protein AV530_007615 [Patagioenas fasciata monilis]
MWLLHKNKAPAKEATSGMSLEDRGIKCRPGHEIRRWFCKLLKNCDSYLNKVFRGKVKPTLFGIYRYLMKLWI